MTLDDEVIEKLKEKADKDVRTTSYIANEILKKHFGIKEKKNG